MRFAIPIFGGTVVRCLSPEAMDRACKRLGVDPPDEPARGWCRQVDHTSGKVIYLLGWYDRDAGTLVHECVHLAQFILQRAGISPVDSNGETMAYLTDYLFTRLKTR